MISFNYFIRNSIGLHVRPAGIIAETASKFRSHINVEFGDKTANAKGMFMLMVLGAKCGDTIKVTIEGEDETEAAEALEKTLDRALGDDC